MRALVARNGRAFASLSQQIAMSPDNRLYVGAKRTHAASLEVGNRLPTCVVRGPKVHFGTIEGIHRPGRKELVSDR